MRGDVCGRRAAYVRGWLTSPHDARYHGWWYAHSACGILPGEQKREQLVLGGTRCSKLLRAAILHRLNRKHRKGGVVGEFAIRVLALRSKQVFVLILGVVLRIGKIPPAVVCELHRAWSCFKEVTKHKCGVSRRES